MGRNVGPFIVVAGIVIAAVGILAWTGGLSWFGHLPGDIAVHRAVPFPAVMPKAIRAKRGVARLSGGGFMQAALPVAAHARTPTPPRRPTARLSDGQSCRR
jgi:Protein of unknown function (DUF2905)